MLQENGIRDLVSDLITSKPSFTAAPTEDWKDGGQDAAGSDGQSAKPYGKMRNPGS